VKSEERESVREVLAGAKTSDTAKHETVKNNASETFLRIGVANASYVVGEMRQPERWIAKYNEKPQFVLMSFWRYGCN